MKGFYEADRDVLEVSIERSGMRALQQLNIVVRKDGRRGWPDRVVYLGHGLHFWWEAKKHRGGRLTPAQRRVIPRLRETGDIVLVRPTLEELVAVALQLQVGHEAAARSAPSAHTEE
jgi:hypothetical protein